MVGAGKTESPSPVNGTIECLLLTCKKHFRPLKKNQRFCCPEHKAEYYRLAYEKGVEAMERGKVHSARLGSSERLQRVLDFLSDGQPHTTRDIIVGANVCAVNTIITELRDNGFVIECKCTGQGKYQYKLTGRAA